MSLGIGAGTILGSTHEDYSQLTISGDFQNEKGIV